MVNNWSYGAATSSGLHDILFLFCENMVLTAVEHRGSLDDDDD